MIPFDGLACCGWCGVTILGAGVVAFNATVGFEDVAFDGVGLCTGGGGAGSGVLGEGDKGVAVMGDSNLRGG